MNGHADGRCRAVFECTQSICDQDPGLPAGMRTAFRSFCMLSPHIAPSLQHFLCCMIDSLLRDHDCEGCLGGGRASWCVRVCVCGVWLLNSKVGLRQAEDQQLTLNGSSARTFSASPV